MTFIPLITINIKLLGHEVISRYRYEESIYHLFDEYTNFMWNITDKG